MTILLCCAALACLQGQEPAAAVPTPPAAAARVAPPDEAAVKKAAALVRTVYAGRYAVKTEAGKRIQARMMLLHAGWHRDDAALMAVLLRESLRLAGEASDYETILAAIDALDAAFTGVVVGEERRKAFEHVARKPHVLALLKLLDSPDDTRACTIAGRWLGLLAGRWGEALPLLRKADEPALQALAGQEADAATAPPELLRAARAWLDFAAKGARADERVGALKHALDLAQRALPGLAGADQAQAQQLIAKTTMQIPLDLDQADWDALTPEQWERIPAPVVNVIAKIDRTDTQCLLKDGEHLRVVPHPTDTWSFTLDDSPAVVTTDWKGVQRSYTFLVNDGTGGGPRKLTLGLGVQGYRYGAVLDWTDVNHKQRPGVLSGPGKVWLGPSSDHKGEVTTSGAIRVKLVPVEE